MEDRPTLEEVIALLDKTYELVYVDYRDNLDHCLDKIQAAVQEQDWAPLDEAIDDGWLSDSQWNAIDYILKELADEMTDAFDIEKEEAEAWIEEHNDALRDEIYNRDRSDPLDDLLRNTSDPVAFYDTGVYIDEPYGSDDVKDRLRTIKKALGLKGKAWDDDLRLMIIQASYGGRLVVYFRIPVEELMKLGEANMVEFTSEPCVAIINTYNGSGDHCHLKDATITLPFDPSNIFLDRTIKYSYVYEVCVMSSNFADASLPRFYKKTTRRQAKKSSLHAEREREERLNAIFKAGGCTAGDMDMKRHRNTYYLNEFPCGTHCPHCGTFWID